jgi:hypothetical protein
MSRRICFSLFLCLLLSSILAIAQETTGGIQGTVKDPQGAVVSGATVEVTSSALIGNKKSVQTDSAGKYMISALPPGSYNLTVTAANFSAYRQTGLDLSAGRLPTIDIQLKVGTATETVEVSSESPIVDVTQSKVAVTVEQQVLQALPKGRSFQSLIPFAPGARQEPLQSTTSNRTGGFQIDGASDSENVYLIDGMNTTNIQNGGVGKSFQTDFIQEVQIKSSSFEAEYGGALGGVVNAVPKHGSNNWHGEVKSYFQTNALNANDPCSSGYTSGGAGTLAGFSTVCGLRLNPNLAQLNAKTRLDGTPEYYIPKKDDRHIIEPGFELGGPIMRDRLWLFMGYVPTFDEIHRKTTFTSGAQVLTNSFTQHNAYSRLDYRPISSLNTFASWNYAYSKTKGLLGNPDSAIGQLNTGRTTNPATLGRNIGTVNPLSVYNFGADWTPTSKLVVSGRFGYFFNNNEDRGRPTGIRYVYQSTVNSTTTDLRGNPFPAFAINNSGFANISSNLQTLFDAYKRYNWNADASYFVGKFFGSHTFKGGYAWQRQSNDVLRTFNTAAVNLNWNSPYTPVTSTTACDQVKAQNVANGLPNVCSGLYGTFTVGTNVVNTGGDKTYSQATYLQDAWTVGTTGLTLNLGVRFDEERLPPYDPKRFPSVKFGWGEKIAPRIGGAYDLLHNGKVKVYASYGKFFDIMKMGLVRGSFGSDYWHNCVYAMDDADYNKITPTFPLGGGCPPSGAAPGVTVGRFIENVDFRKTKEDPRDPAIQTNMKPMQQHEFVTGVDWAITPTWGLETRYSRKRLDRTIEDMAITDDLGFYIGNPGTPFADVLHRKVIVDPTIGLEGPFCAECPPVVGAIRKYDGMELRLSKRPTGRWYGAVSYTYSKLRGNYSGLTDSDPTDGAGGRHSPNNHRAFDLPNMTYLGNGKIDDGPLSTDRPHTAKVFGYYQLKWLGQETWIGFTQSAFQGSPVSTCLSVIGTSSACQWAEGRGGFVHFTRAANGDYVQGSINHSARTDPFFQTDLNIRHEVKLTERYRLGLEANVLNFLNQHSELAVDEFIFADTTNMVITPSRTPRFASDPGFDWNKVMRGFNYTQEVNTEGFTLRSRYGHPNVFQTARNFRLAVRFTF